MTVFVNGLPFYTRLGTLSNVSFGHQSMSFKKDEKHSTTASLFGTGEHVSQVWSQAVNSVAEGATSLIAHPPRTLYGDARTLTTFLPQEHYNCVITSPPYPNRMSYIRELRPYMYWLNYLRDARDAGELDWQAIGGTWGCATSNVGKWQPPSDDMVPFEGFDAILNEIGVKSRLLSRYVHKYFYDIIFHCRELFSVVRPAGTVHYIVGNSKFYDTMLPVEEIYAALFRATGFEDVAVRAIRKRTSKKELYEFVVSARKPTQ